MIAPLLKETGGKERYQDWMMLRLPQRVVMRGCYLFFPVPVSECSLMNLPWHSVFPE